MFRAYQCVNIKISAITINFKAAIELYKYCSDEEGVLFIRKKYKRTIFARNATHYNIQMRFFIEYKFTVKMYGLLLENLAEYIKINYGEDKWDDIRRQAGIDSPSFSVHQVYPENLLNKLAKKAQQVYTETPL